MTPGRREWPPREDLALSRLGSLNHSWVDELPVPWAGRPPRQQGDGVELDTDPLGPVGSVGIRPRQCGPLDVALREVAEDRAVVATLRLAAARARDAAEADERRQVAEQVRSLIVSSGLTRSQFAMQISTSASRLSTYATGKVTPSATLLLRMQSLRK